MSLDSDELVRRYVCRQFQSEENRKNAHLESCPEIIVVIDDAYDSVYGCDTGCEYVRFEATISCPHSEPIEYTYGEFDDLAGIIKDMKRDEAHNNL